MNPYQKAWLAAHPHRTAEWLKERLADGFDIHHLDGDHSNNAADNLVLIETADHLMVHGGIFGGKGRLVPHYHCGGKKIRSLRDAQEASAETLARAREFVAALPETPRRWN